MGDRSLTALTSAWLSPDPAAAWPGLGAGWIVATSMPSDFAVASIRARSEAAGLPVLGARIEPEPGAARALAGKRVFAFAGIGRPEKLFATLEALGCELAARRAFPDHHRYSPNEIMALAEAASDLGAVPVTTEKDAARLPEAARAMIATLPVRLVFDDVDALDHLLARALLGRQG